MDWRPEIVAGDNASSLEGSVETSISSQKMPNDESYCNSVMDNDFVREKSYGTNHPHQMEHEYHLEMIMEQTYKPLLLVEGEAFRRMVTHIDTSI